MFRCAIYFPIALPQWTKKGHQRRLGIYVEYEFPSIIKYLKPSIDELFMAQFVYYHFDQYVFSTLRGENK